MTESRPPNRWPTYARVPRFIPVPLRARADGWTPERQASFIGLLAECGSVGEAARRVGMSRMAAYRLRRSPGAESLAHAWDAVLSVRGGKPVPHRKVTAGELAEHAIEGAFHVLLRRGKFVRAQRKPNVSALLRHMRRLDAAACQGGWDRL